MKGVDFNDRHTIYLPSVTIADSKIVNGIVPVTASSRLGLKEVVERFGYYLKRENHYDFPPYEADDDGDEKYKAYLFLTNYSPGVGKSQPCGAAFFEWVTQDKCDEPGYFSRWWLMWVWIHPYERGSGELQRAWTHFKEEFGDFHVQPPLSKAMERFLEKQKVPLA